MEKTTNGWQIIDREAGVLSYTYSFGPGTANAFTARLADGRLLVVSPPYGVDEPVFADLQEFGEVGALVANNGFHHLGLAEWKARFPDVRVFAAPETAARVKKKNPGAPAFEPMNSLQPLLSTDVAVIESPNTKCGETWAWVKTPSGYAWYTSDILVNLDSLPKNLLLRLMFKLTGTKTGFGVFHTALKFTANDKNQLLSALRNDMKTHPPSTIVPAHGAVLARPGLAAEADAVLAI